MTDRITGLKERVKGTVKRDPDLKEQGKERMTGELKRKEREEVSPSYHKYLRGVEPFLGAEHGSVPGRRRREEVGRPAAG